MVLRAGGPAQQLGVLLGGGLGPRDATEEALISQWTLLAATAIEAPALEIMMIQNNGGGATPEGQAALAIAAVALREGVRAWRGEACCPPLTVVTEPAAPAADGCACCAPALPGQPVREGGS